MTNGETVARIQYGIGDTITLTHRSGSTLVHRNVIAAFDGVPSIGLVDDMEIDSSISIPYLLLRGWAISECIPSKPVSPGPYLDRNDDIWLLKYTGAFFRLTRDGIPCVHNSETSWGSCAPFTPLVPKK